MALGCDRVDYLQRTVTGDFEIVQDVITALGVWYCGRKIIRLCYDAYVGFRNFVWARLYRVDFVEKYGVWAVVTGATDGIGKEYARELARRGMKVVLVSRNAEKLQNVAEELALETQSHFSIVVADFSEGPGIYGEIQRALDGLDIGVLVNNVGISRSGYPYFIEMTEKECRDMLEVNNNAMVAMTRLVLPGMVSRRRGAVVNLSSVAGTNPMPLISLYSSTKTFVTAFSTCLAFEYGSSGVTFQSVTPFYVRPPMTRHVADRFTSLSKIFYPDACSFARSAVATIPYARDTMGHWSHALLYYFLSFFGPNTWGRLVLRRNLKLHEDIKRRS